MYKIYKEHQARYDRSIFTLEDEKGNEVYYFYITGDLERLARSGSLQEFLNRCRFDLTVDQLNNAEVRYTSV